MKVDSFIAQIFGEQQLPSLIFIHYPDSYPLLFCTYIMQRINSLRGQRLQLIDSENFSIAQIQQQIQNISFEGPCWYWIKGSSDSKKNLALSEYIAKYKGENSVWYISEANDAVIQPLPVLLPSHVTQSDLGWLTLLFAPYKLDKIYLSRLIKESGGKLSLEAITLLIHYYPVLGKNSERFFKEWLGYLQPHQTSLFTLAQYFFAQQAPLFYHHYALLSGAYNSPFWITFWMDLCFKGAFYIEYMQQKKTAAAKSISIKLPFSFINKDWRLYKPSQLINAHQYLYQVDYQSKNSSNETALETFYTLFFTNYF